MNLYLTWKYVISVFFPTISVVGERRGGRASGVIPGRSAPRPFDSGKTHAAITTTDIITISKSRLCATLQEGVFVFISSK